jgi:hypothetical protein
MSPTVRRLAGGAVTLLALFIVVVLVVELTGGRGAVAVSASPSPSLAPGASAPAASASASSAGASPSASDSQDAQATFGQIQQQVEQLRGLAPAGIGPAEIIDRAQLEKELADEFRTEYPKSQQEADNLTLRALGLLKADEDIAALQLQLLQGQVIGFYDDKKKRMVVVSGAGVNAEAKITYAHEYTHALQDHAFGLAKLGIDQPGEDDRAMARLALVEGDATYTMFLWALRHMTQHELQGVAGTPQPDTTGIPDWMIEQLTFSYTAGMQFVMALYQRDGSSFQAVDQAFRERPPNTTEQILHPAKYFAQEGPMEVAVPRPAATLGSGWKDVESTTMGEEMTALLLRHLGVPAATATAAAAGWGGDELTAASGPDGAFALAWRLRWDSAADADQFAAAYATARGSLEFPAQLVKVSDTEQLVVQGSSQAVVDRLAAAR